MKTHGEPEGRLNSMVVRGVGIGIVMWWRDMAVVSWHVVVVVEWDDGGGMGCGGWWEIILMVLMGIWQPSMPKAVRNGTCIIKFNNLLCWNSVVVWLLKLNIQEVLGSIPSLSIYFYKLSKQSWSSSGHSWSFLVIPGQSWSVLLDLSPEDFWYFTRNCLIFTRNSPAICQQFSAI